VIDELTLMLARRGGERRARAPADRAARVEIARPKPAAPATAAARAATRSTTAAPPAAAVAASVVRAAAALRAPASAEPAVATPAEPVAVAAPVAAVAASSPSSGSRRMFGRLERSTVLHYLHKRLHGGQLGGGCREATAAVAAGHTPPDS